MGLTVTRDADRMNASKIHKMDLLWTNGLIAFTGTYATNGVPVVASDFGFTQDLVELIVLTTGAEWFVFDKANLKIKVFTADGTEATNGSDQTAVAPRFLAFGR